MMARRADAGPKKRQKPREWNLENEFSKVKKAMLYDRMIAAIDARPLP